MLKILTGTVIKLAQHSNSLSRPEIVHFQLRRNFFVIRSSNISTQKSKTIYRSGSFGKLVFLLNLHLLINTRTRIKINQLFSDMFNSLKGLSHEIDFKNFDKKLHNLALLRVAAGF
jgi:hypothetical protein